MQARVRELEADNTALQRLVADYRADAEKRLGKGKKC